MAQMDGPHRLEDRIQEEPMAPALEGFARRQAHDLEPVLDRGRSGRRHVLPDPLRHEQRPGQSLALRPAAVERALQAGAHAARQPGTRPPVSRDGSPVLRLRAAAPRGAPHPYRAGAPLGDRLSEERPVTGAVDLPGYRRVSSAITAVSRSFGGNSPCAMIKSWNSR